MGLVVMVWLYQGGVNRLCLRASQLLLILLGRTANAWWMRGVYVHMCVYATLSRVWFLGPIRCRRKRHLQLVPMRHLGKMHKIQWVHLNVTNSDCYLPTPRNVSLNPL